MLSFNPHTTSAKMRVAETVEFSPKINKTVYLPHKSACAGLKGPFNESISRPKHLKTASKKMSFHCWTEQAACLFLLSGILVALVGRRLMGNIASEMSTRGKSLTTSRATHTHTQTDK